MCDPNPSWNHLCQIAVKGAEYNSRERQPHPKCLPETRVEFLAHINELLDNDQEKRIIWVNGMAGVGKSAVAFTIADRMRRLNVTKGRPKEKRLAGTFFFSRKYTKRCMTGYFFATLVYQLANNFPSIRGDVIEAISNNPSLLDPDKPLPDQMEALFLEPLRRLKPRLDTHPPVVFVVDALDECTSEAETTDLIALLGEALRDPGLPVIHILLTSRPEAHIRAAIQQDGVHPLVHEIPEKISGAGVARMISLDGADVDSDIYILLRHEFKMLRNRYENFPQPTRRILKRLASRAGRRFIVASTMMKFINDGYNDPRDRLQLMLELTNTLLPGTEVFKLYDQIISTCADPLRVYQHLSVVATLSNPLPIAQISELLGPGEGKDVERALVQLRSLMDVPTNPDLPVGIYHSSVRDYVSNPSHCGLEGKQRITPAHPLLVCASFRLMIDKLPVIDKLPESMGLLDALSELNKHSQAIEPRNPQSIMDSLPTLTDEPPTPLGVIMTLVWLRGDRSPPLRSWLSIKDGGVWLNTQKGRDWLEAQGLDWLQIEEGEEWLVENLEFWLATQSGKDWLNSQSGWNWLRTKNGHRWLNYGSSTHWLRSSSGCTWLDSPSGRDWLSSGPNIERHVRYGLVWLQSPGGLDWLQSSSGNKWLRSGDGSKWLNSQEGKHWLQSKGGKHWLSILKCDMLAPNVAEIFQENLDALLAILDEEDWLQTPNGTSCLETAIRGDWLPTWSGEKWLRTPRGKARLSTWGGDKWLGTPRGEAWLLTRDGDEWLGTAGGQKWLQTEDARVWLQTEGGLEWQQIKNSRAELQTYGDAWLGTEEGREWLQTDDGHEWLYDEEGVDWLQSKSGAKWLESESTSSLRWLNPDFAKDWLKTTTGRRWLKTENGRSWLDGLGLGVEDPVDRDIKGPMDWLDSKCGNKWLQTRDGQEWLDTESGQSQVPWRWLDTQSGREWLQSQSGYQWQRSHHAEQWLAECGVTPDFESKFWLNDFLETLEAITTFSITPDFSFLPPFRAIQQFKSLPDFLMFPAFLALTPRTDHRASKFNGGPDIDEVIHAMNAFVSFADKARKRIESQTTSGALMYACQNWARHLSRVPNPWDDKLDRLFNVFWNKHLLSWLERQWISRGLRSCLHVLSEAQTVVAKKLAESSQTSESDLMQDVIAH